FIRFAIPKLFITGGFIFLLLSALSPYISAFLKLEAVLPVIIMSVYFLISLPLLVNKAVLSGTLSFKYLTLNGFFEIGLKLLVSVILVLFNFKLIGALIGPVAGLVTSLLLSHIELSYILKSSEKTKVSYSWDRVIKKLIPFFLITFALNSMINLDIILVKHFFDAKIAGDYVALSTVGKIIFYIVGPVISVMFPLISNRVEKGTSYILPLLGTLALTLAMNLMLVFSYFVFPKAIISSLFGRNYLGAVPYMGTFAFFMSVYTVNSVLSYFLISISYFKPVYFLFTVSLFQGVFLFLFHNSVSQVIYINIIISLMYLATVFYFVLQHEKGIINRIFRKLNI
ncbi:hypothetical protein A2Y99_02295, partial [Candidatus Gottesmanbacteria bacterium RBG_13_37_7]